MVGLKNMYENQLLAEYTSPTYDVKKVEGLIEAYTTARLKECQLNTEFASAMKTPNAHIYIKTLRERVMSELRMDEEASLSEFTWTKLPEFTGEDPTQTFDVEGRYNMGHLNNENAIGYNNLEGRAANIDQNNAVAHETAFDAMLADFFLQKRGDYKKGNQLQADLEAFFDEQLTAKNLKSKKPLEHGHPATAHGDNHSLGFHYMSQTVGKEDTLEFIPQNLGALFELDIAVNKRLNNNKSGLSKELRSLESTDCIIPEYFDKNDVRKPANIYVQEKLL